MPAKKGQKFQRYSKETKLEAVRLFVEDKLPYAEIQKRLGIRSHSQIMDWFQKYKAGETFEDYRGRWNKKHFSSTEEENA
jgi:transposase-like protein